jgi:protein TonB
MSKASYAGLVLAELNRRKFFPAAARAAGVTGAVGVAFTIGPSGRVVSASITRSSGDSALDGAARAILGALHAPPPPGGAFSTATSIRFNLN